MVSFVFLLVLCTIQTAQSESVHCQSSCECEVDEPCELQCTGKQTCQGSSNVFTCRPGYPCTVTCDTSDRGSHSTCGNATILANGASNLTVQCLGARACEHTVVLCHGTDHCDITCRHDYRYYDPAVCGAMQLDCDTSDCKIECGSNKACAEINIDTDNASSFECHQVCNGDTIPTTFTRADTTTQPITTHTARGDTTQTPSDVATTTTVSDVSTTDTTSVSNPFTTTDESTTSVSGPSTTSVSGSSTTDYTNDSNTSVSGQSTTHNARVDTTQTLSGVTTSSSILSSTPQTEHTSINATVTTQSPMDEQEVVEKTTHVEYVNTDINSRETGEDTDETQVHMQILMILEKMWLRIAIGGCTVCCLCICGLVFILRCKKKQALDSHKAAPVPIAIGMSHTPIAVPSQTGTPVTMQSATTTPIQPVTPNKMSLCVVNDAHSMPQSFSEYLENERLAASMVTDDVVADMMSTPGGFDHDVNIPPAAADIDCVDDALHLSPVYLVHEGGLSDAYCNDDEILNGVHGEESVEGGNRNDETNANTDDDDILSDVNQMTELVTGEDA